MRKRAASRKIVRGAARRGIAGGNGGFEKASGYMKESIEKLSLEQFRLLRRHLKQLGGSAEGVAPLRAQRREGHLPLSYAQERLWFLDQMALTGAAYNM